jgi:hypothetical protein
MPELDPPQSERRHSPSPSQNDLDDDGNPQCMPDPEHGNEDSQQGDDDAAPGREAQPDDLPGVSRFPLALSHKTRWTGSCMHCGSTHVTLGVNTRQTHRTLTGIWTMKITAW